MNICIKLCTVIILACLAKPLFGQSGASQLNPRPLQPGDTIPAELWNTPLQLAGNSNGSDQEILEHYKDKLTIIDFWATWCSPCVAMLPRMDSLQQQWEEKLQFLSVTYQNEQEITEYMAKLNQHKGISIKIPKVVENTLLSKWFPHRTIPHYVWIKDGVVKAITGKEEITAEKIAAMIHGQAVSLKTKKDDLSLGYPSGRVSLVEFLSYNKPEAISNFSFRSVFSPYIPGLSSAMSFVRPTEDIPVWRFTVTNLPPIHLYQYAYGELTTFTNWPSIAIESVDSLILKPRYIQGQTKDHRYCYELVIPESQASRGFQIFRDQLTALFPQYHAVVENRMMPVLALERFGNVPLKTSSATKFKNSYDGFTYEFTGGSPLAFVKGLNGLYLFGFSSRTVVDHTGFDERIDMTLTANMSNVESLNKALQPYGLRLVEKEATIPILVIKDAMTIKMK